MSKIQRAIKSLVDSGDLKQPFRVADVNSIDQNILGKSPSFLSKHCEGNPGGYRVYYKRVERGKYNLQDAASK
jgi:hypothetical protein